MSSTRGNQEQNNQIKHYRLAELLVEQTISALYLAHDEKTNEPVFLVTLQPDAIKSSELSDRFQRRAETLSQIEHEAILPMLEFGMDGKRPYAVLPYREGMFLQHHLEKPAQSPAADAPKSDVVASLKLVRQIAAALALAHPTGLIHHDLRPENIYLDQSGQPLLLDLVVPPTPPIISQAERAPVTELDYQSPEQQAGKALSGRSNIFSLGVLLYRLLAGHKPELPVSEWGIFEQKGAVREIPLEKVRPDLTPATYKAVQESIWQKEWSRFETINLQIAAIDRAIDQEAAPPPPPPPAWLLLLRNLIHPRNRKYVVPAVVLLFLLLLAIFFMRGRGNQPQNDTLTPEPIINLLETDLPNESDATPGTEPTTSPTATNPSSVEENSAEAELLPPAEATETATPSPSATATAVPSSSATATAVLAAPTQTPTVELTSTATNTSTPTLSPEPTQTNCTPSPPFGWVRYTIQENDSLASLSQATNTTVDQLRQVNCLTSNLLSIGQEIWLPFSPNPTETAVSATNTPSATATSSGDEPPPPTSPPATSPPPATNTPPPTPTIPNPNP